MPVDMKEAIAAAARTLVMDKHVKKLTVKDIVEECGITRQAFYYHFADIPELLQWVLERETTQILQRSRQQGGGGEQGLRRFFQLAIQARPYIRRGMQTGYRDELERMITDAIYRCFAEVVEREDLYRGYSRAEVRLILRYHTQAVTGLLESWTDEDSKNLDQIVSLVYRMVQGEISPRG